MGQLVSVAPDRWTLRRWRHSRQDANRVLSCSLVDLLVVRRGIPIIKLVNLSRLTIVLPRRIVAFPLQHFHKGGHLHILEMAPSSMGTEARLSKGNAHRIVPHLNNMGNGRYIHEGFLVFQQERCLCAHDDDRWIHLSYLLRVKIICF